MKPQTGDKLGYFTVLYPIYYKLMKDSKVVVQCVCGRVKAYPIEKGFKPSSSCGCMMKSVYHKQARAVWYGNKSFRKYEVEQAWAKKSKKS